MERATFGYVSLSGHAEEGDDRPYLEWHQLDHMPEQFSVPGIVWGQRWASTARCRQARLVEDGDWGEVAHLTTYLMHEPIEPTLDQFLALGQRLREAGRFSLALPSKFQGALRLLGTYAAPRALIAPDTVPFRPNRGVYLIMETPDGNEGWNGYVQNVHGELIPELLGIPGVAGAWIFGSTSLRPRDLLTPGTFQVMLIYLDDDPTEIASEIAVPLNRSLKNGPTRPLLAAPFEALMRWEWDRFQPGIDQ